MAQKIRVLIGTCAALVAMVTSAAAQGTSASEDPKWPLCRTGGDSRTADRTGAIAACTALISAETSRTKRAEAYMWRGYARFWRDEPDLAIKDFVAATDLDADNATAWAWQGATFDVQRRFSDAVERLNRALALTPDAPGPLMYRGIAFAGLGLKETAMADLNDAVRRLPDWAYGLYARSVVRRTMGDTAGANADRAAAIQKDAEIDRKMARFFEP